MNMEFLPIWLEGLNREFNPEGIDAQLLDDNDLQAFMQTPKVKNLIANVPEGAPVVTAIEVAGNVHLLIRSDAGITVCVIFLSDDYDADFLTMLANTIVQGFLEAVKERGVQALPIPSPN